MQVAETSEESNEREEDTLRQEEELAVLREELEVERDERRREREEWAGADAVQATDVARMRNRCEQLEQELVSLQHTAEVGWCAFVCRAKMRGCCEQLEQESASLHEIDEDCWCVCVLVCMNVCLYACVQEKELEGFRGCECIMSSSRKS